jgi:O-antigen ligase
MGSPSGGGPESRSVEWARTLLWLNLLATAVVFSARTTEGFELPKTAVVRGVGLLLAVGMAAVFAGGADRRRRLAVAVRSLASDPIALGVLLSLLAAVVSTALSVSPRTSLRGAQGSFMGLQTLAAYGVIFFATRAVCRTADAARGVLAGGVVGLGLAVAYGAVQLAGLDPLRWEAPIVYAGVQRVFSTEGHPNSFAQLLATATPLAGLFFARAARARRYGEATLLGLVCAGAIGLVGLTLSRAGVLALAAAAGVMLGGMWRKGLPARRGALLIGALALVVAGVGLTSNLGEGFRAMAGRLAGSAPPGELRRFLWAGAWGAFLDHPFVGVGVDCLSLVFGRYRTAAAWAAEWGETPLKAHCEPLEILATRGLLGAAAALVLLLGLGRAGLRAVRATSTDAELAVASLAGLTAFLVHIVFHFPTAAGTSLAVTLAAVLLVPAEEMPARGPDGRVAKGVGIAAGAIAGALLYFLVLEPLRADVLGQAGTVLVHTDPRQATALEREAVRLDPSRDLLWLRLAAALQAEGLGEAEPGKRKAFLEEARRAGERGMSLVPGSAYDQAYLGTLLADLERESPPLADRTEVERAFGRAEALDPNNADILMAAADAALSASDLDRARAWADRASIRYPRFGWPRGLVGAVALVEARRLAESGQASRAQARANEATALLREALAGEWHGEERSRAATEANLAKAQAIPGP